MESTWNLSRMHAMESTFIVHARALWNPGGVYCAHRHEMESTWSSLRASAGTRTHVHTRTQGKTHTCTHVPFRTTLPNVLTKYQNQNGLGSPKDTECNLPLQ